MPRSDKVIRRSFRCGIGRIRTVGGLFREKTFGTERAEDFIRGHVMEAEALALFAFQRPPMRKRCLQQRECTNDVGLEKLAGAINRAVYMRLGGEMHQHIGTEAAD